MKYENLNPSWFSSLLNANLLTLFSAWFQKYASYAKMFASTISEYTQKEN